MLIKVMPTFCKVFANKEEENWLRNILTIDVPGAKYTQIYRRRQWDGRKRFFHGLSKTFPIGFLDYVLSKKENRYIRIEDLREFCAFDNILPKLNIELRDYQKQAIIDCLKYKNCIIQAATNSGKTAMFAGLIKKMYPIKTLILIHREEILWQIKKMVEEYTDLKIGIITAGDILIKPTTVAMVATLVNRIGSNQEVTDFFNNVECIIIDEVHHAVNKTISGLLSSSKAVYRFGFSGTVPEEDTYAGMLVRQWIGSVVLRVTNEELIESGISAKPKIHIYEMDVSSRIRGVFDVAKQNLLEKVDNYTPQQLLKEVYRLSVERGIVENGDRNNKILEVYEKYKDKSILIVVDYLKHGNIVEELFKQNGINAVFISGSSEVRKEAFDAFKQGTLKILISTNIIDEGVDISRIEVLILLAGKKSRRQLLQRIGRSLRRKEGDNVVNIFDFMDYGSKYLERHSKIRLKIYQQEKFEIEFV